MDKKQDPTICYLQKNHFSFKDTHQIKVRDRKNIFYASGNQKEVMVAILITDKIDFNPKNGNKRQRRSLYNDKVIYSLRSYNSHKYICT